MAIQKIAGGGVLSNDLQQWKAAANDWLTNFSSERTRRAYLEAWQAFMSFVGKDPDTMTQSDVLAYRQHMETTASARTGRPYTQATINQHLSAISSFFSFAVGRGLRSDNPADGVKRKAVNPYGKATYLNGSRNEDIAFLAAINRSTIQGKRDYAMMLIFLTTAVRVGAIANLRYGDFRRQGPRWFMTYTNKGGQTVETELQPTAIEALTEYLDTRPTLSANDPVFIATERGQQNIARLGHEAGANPLTDRMIGKLVKKYADKAFGKGHGIHPHSLRHTAAMNAAAYASVPQLAGLLGHKSTRITDIYIQHISKDATNAVIEKLDSRYQTNKGEG